MKVAIYNNHLKDSIGGSELQCHQIAKLLSKYHDVVYFAINGDRDAAEYSNYRVVNIKITNVRQAYMELKSEKVNVIYWRYDRRKSYYIWIAAKMLGISFIYAISHYVDSKKYEVLKQPIRIDANPALKMKRLAYKMRRSLRGILGSYVQMYSDVVICQTREQMHEASKWIKRSKIELVKNTLGELEEVDDGKIFADIKEDRCILWIGSIKGSKRPEYFLEIAKRLSKENVKFVMVGKVKDEIYGKMISEAAAVSQLVYLGQLTLAMVLNLIRKSLFTVHTYEKEGFPNVLLQSWYCSKATINISYDPDGIISKNRLGKVANSLEEAIDYVKYYLSMAEECVADGKRCRKYYEDNHDHLVEYNKLENIMMSQIDKHKNRN